MISNGTFAALRTLIGRGEVVVSEHGYDELANDGLFARETVEEFVGGRFVSCSLSPTFCGVCECRSGR